jgi:hypothetical protein
MNRPWGDDLFERDEQAGAGGDEPGGLVEGFGRSSGAVPVETGIGSGYNCCEEVKKIFPAHARRRAEAVNELGQAPSRPLIFKGFRRFRSEPVPFFHSLAP